MDFFLVLSILEILIELDFWIILDNLTAVYKIMVKFLVQYYMRKNSQITVIFIGCFFFFFQIHMDVSVLAEQQRFKYISSVQTLDAV